jgi:hypothetical protein
MAIFSIVTFDNEHNTQNNDAQLNIIQYKTLRIMTLSLTLFSIKTLSIMMLTITKLSIKMLDAYVDSFMQCHNYVHYAECCSVSTKY